jgi:hypothetical protein
MRAIFWLAEKLLASQEVLCSIELAEICGLETADELPVSVHGECETVGTSLLVVG